MTQQQIEQQKAIEEIIIRTYRRASDPTWPVTAAKSIMEFLLRDTNARDMAK